MNALNAIPVAVPSQIAFRDFLKKNFSTDSLMGIGIRVGTFYCHYGELLRRREGDPEISDIGISNTQFEEKMGKLLENAPFELLTFLKKTNE